MNRGRHAGRHEGDGLPGLYRAVHDAHVRNHAAELVKHGVEHKRAQRGVHALRGRRRNAVHDRLEHIGASDARLCGDVKRIVHRNRKNILNLPAHLRDVRAGKIDLVQHGHDLKLCVLREIRVGYRLRLHALCGIYDKQRTLAGPHRTGHLIREVHVAGSVEKVEEIRLSVLRRVLHRHRMALDRDASFALKIHGVKGLRLELAGAYGMGKFENAI